MSVCRVVKTRDFAIMSNHLLKNNNLPLKAKGLLSYMLSLPEDWNYTISGLTVVCMEGRAAIREAVKELERQGYVVRTRVRDEQGRLRNAEYTIYEVPHSVQDKPASENPEQGKAAQEKSIQEDSVQENPRQLNTKQANTYPSKTYKPITHAENPNPSNPNPSIHVQRETMEELRETIRENIGYDCLVNEFNRQRLDDIVELIVETLSTSSETITISGEAYPAALVRQRFMQINSLHIEYIFSCLEKSGSDIRNIKRYLLPPLFNAPATMENFMESRVQREIFAKMDMKNAETGGIHA